MCLCVETYRFVMGWQELPAFVTYLSNWHPEAIRTLITLRPFRKNVWNIVVLNWYSLVVERKAITGKFVKPHLDGGPAFLKDENCCSHTRVRLEYPRWQ